MTMPLTPRSAYNRQEMMDRMGPATTENEADEMRDLLISAGFTDADECSEREWNRILADVTFAAFDSPLRNLTVEEATR